MIRPGSWPLIDEWCHLMFTIGVIFFAVATSSALVGR